MSKKQTALSYYEIGHRRLLIKLESKEITIGEYAVSSFDLYKQALQMEREQLADFYINGMYKGQEVYFNEPNIKLDVNSLDYCIEQSENCYTQTFKP